MRVAWIMAGIIVFDAASSAGVVVDDRGVRKTLKAPAPGVHPRVFFTAEEIPDLKRRVNDSWVGKNMTTIVGGQLRQQRASWEAFAKLDLSDPTPEQVAEYSKPDPKRNVLWGCCAVLAIARDDVELRKLMIDTISNYARIILASKEMALGADLDGETGKVLNERFKVWRENAWTAQSALKCYFGRSQFCVMVFRAVGTRSPAKPG